MTPASDAAMRDLYRELILDHARSPRNFGSDPAATHVAEGVNPLCGDKLKIYLTVADGDSIEKALFEGTGCAISVASASLLTERVRGMRTDEATAFAESVIDVLTGRLAGQSLGKLDALRGISEYPSRVKCATLAWRALESAISGRKSPATTE